MSEKVKMSLMSLRAQTLHRSSSSQQPFEESFGSNEENDDALEHLHNVLRDMLRKTIDVDAAVLQRGKQQGRENHTDWMISTEQCHGDTGEAVVVREAIVISITIAHHFIDADHTRECARHCHGENDLFANRDAAVLSR